MTSVEDRARAYKALGDPTRLRILEFLACRCEVAVDEEGDVRPIQGATVGEVCCHITGVDTVTSTISHHVKELKNAGLIEVRRKGRYMVCRVNEEAMESLGVPLLPNPKPE